MDPNQQNNEVSLSQSQLSFGLRKALASQASFVITSAYVRMYEQ